MKKEDIVKTILFLCKRDPRHIEPKQIYFDQDLKEGMIFGDPKLLDQLWNVQRDGKIITFTPMEDIDKYEKIVKDSNLIYESK